MSKLYTVMYHYVRDLAHSRYPNIKGLDVKLFENQIKFLSSKCNIITMEEVICAVKSNSDLPNNAMLLTFDDGYADNYLYVFPILEKFGLQGSFFIPGKTFTTHELLDVNRVHYVLASIDDTCLVEDLMKLLDKYRGKEYDYDDNQTLFKKYAIASRFDTEETVFIKKILQTVLPENLRTIICKDLFNKYVGISETQLAYELYLTTDQIHTMKNHGMFIGCHGYDHYWLGNLKKKRMQDDISRGLECIDEFVDNDCWVMNYPYGSYNQDVLNYIASNGACLGFTTDVRVADTKQDNALELPRLDCNDFPPKSDNFVLL